MTQAPTTVETARRQAEELHARAAAALATAREAQARAEAAGQVLAAKRDAAKRRWAQRIVTAYPTEIEAAEQAFTAARAAFDRTVINEPGRAIESYAELQDCYLRVYAVTERMSMASGTLGQDYRTPGGFSLPPWSDAIDNALSRRLTNRNAELREQSDAELQAILDGVSG